jgi:hypothetical protein
MAAVIPCGIRWYSKRAIKRQGNAREKPMRATTVALLVSCLSAPLAALAADETEKFGDAPPPPAMTVPVPDHDDDPADGEQPEVTIVQRKDAKIEEYRLNGRLYMVKVTPFVGPPYYHVDRDGDGLMESKITGRGAEPRAPQWVILSW